MGALREYVNGQFEENFDTTFMENIKKLLKKSVFFFFFFISNKKFLKIISYHYILHNKNWA